MSRRRNAPREIDGVIVVDKPAGPTSFDVIRQVRRALGTSRVGHTGTLDPLASGLLVVCAGWSTRLVPYLLEGRKRYVAEVRLGVATNTDDAEGEVIAEIDPSAVTADAVVAALQAELGRRLQRPPAYSAIKVGGVRAYALARAGEEVDLAEREVDIYEVADIEHSGAAVRFEVEVGKGTYIRSLARDLGVRLGVGAHLTALRRTGNAPFGLSDAVALEAVVGPEQLISPWSALRAVPAVELGDDAVARWFDGATVEGTARLGDAEPAGTLVRVARSGAEELIGLGEVLGDGRVRPVRVRPPV
ncbi:MAG: tRNA pseudouridine(55) synthase TruB [Myxococcales bacterium]|nr:tRNA pseudouridine(55) synthase TruB [Myxococcales bacterium]MCB9520712.1 tRNA pseudouridine(55) synthase TruB [Myxococcales bacterium]MCB9532116.1 tRNA pseudouridine(55) synthase TruB [Myxococcales bacterium]